MKVAASATGKDFDSQIDPRFGRSAYFIIIETDDMSFEAFKNENIDMNTGAGISSANFVVSKGVKALLTGNCGPKAMQVFSAAGIDVFTGQTGTVKNSVENYRKGLLQSSPEATVPEKAGISGTGASTGGMGAGRGQGMGGGGRGMGMSGGGRGMGGGGGMGMGGGRGMGGCRGGGGGGRGMGGGGRFMTTGAGIPALNTAGGNSPATKEEELRMLKEQSENLKKQMQDIENRINNLK